MIAYVGFGVLSALIGFVPYPLVQRFTEANRSSERMNPVAFWIIGVLVSLVLLVATLFVCKKIAADGLVAFAIAEMATFLAAIVVYAVVLVKRG